MPAVAPSLYPCQMKPRRQPQVRRHALPCQLLRLLCTYPSQLNPCQRKARHQHQVRRHLIRCQLLCLLCMYPCQLKARHQRQVRPSLHTALPAEAPLQTPGGKTCNRTPAELMPSLHIPVPPPASSEEACSSGPLQALQMKRRPPPRQTCFLPSVCGQDVKTCFNSVHGIQFSTIIDVVFKSGLMQ